MILISEDVWGTPFEALEGSFPIARHEELWKNPEELKNKIANVEALVVRNRTQVSAEIIAAAPKLKVIARAGVGLDNIDLSAADTAGVVVVAGLGANAVSVGEFTLGLALASLRNIPAHNESTKFGNWNRAAGRELSGLTWGLLGCGATGLATARLIAGFSCTILGYDPFVQPTNSLIQELNVQLTSFGDLLKRSDVVSIHMPATEQTINLIDAQALSIMKKSAIIINVGRGEVIHEDALLQALKNEEIAGAALDVRTTEPPQIGELEKLSNVIVAPHVAGITKESQLRINQILAKNISLVLSGSSATHAVGKIQMARLK